MGPKRRRTTRHSISALYGTVLIAVVALACGQVAPEPAAAPAAPEAAPAPAQSQAQDQPVADAEPVADRPSAKPREGEIGEAGTGEAQEQSGRQLVVEAWMSLEVADVDNAAREVETLAASKGGWIESAEVSGDGGYRTADIAIRVPAGRLRATLDTLRGLGRVADEGTSSLDVTDQIVNMEARMYAWQVQEERLIQLMARTDDIESIIELEHRIAEVREEINRMEVGHRGLTNRSDTSLVRVNLHLPPRFAADPPTGSIVLAVASPAEGAQAIAERTEALGGYVGSRVEYQEGQSTVVELAAFVRPNAVATLLAYAESLGEPSGRRLASVGPTSEADVPNATIEFTIRSNVESAASLELTAEEPIAVAGRLRARVGEAGGYVEHWEEIRWDDDTRERVDASFIVSAPDLRPIMDFGTTLGETERWVIKSVGEASVDSAPNSRLTFVVQTDPPFNWELLYVIVPLGVLVVGFAIWMYRRDRASRAQASPATPTASREIEQHAEHAEGE